MGFLDTRPQLAFLPTVFLVLFSELAVNLLLSLSPLRRLLELRHLVSSLAYWTVLLALSVSHPSKQKVSLAGHELSGWFILANISSLLLLGGSTFLSVLPCLEPRQMLQSLLFAFANGFLEELFWRRTVLGELGNSTTSAWLVSSVLFGLRHAIWSFFNFPASRLAFSVPMAVLATTGVGLFWGYEYIQNRRNFGGIAAHHIFLCILAIYPQYFNILNGANCKPPVSLY